MQPVARLVGWAILAGSLLVGGCDSGPVVDPEADKAGISTTGTTGNGQSPPSNRRQMINPDLNSAPSGTDKL